MMRREFACCRRTCVMEFGRRAIYGGWLCIAAKKRGLWRLNFSADYV